MSNFGKFSKTPKESLTTPYVVSVNGKWGIVNLDIQDVNELEDVLKNHHTDFNNPHKVTKAQVGLDNVNNTSDLEKPISIENKEALDKKAEITYVDSEISTVNTKADNAIATANVADTKATLAVDTANTAKTTADSANAALPSKVDKTDIIDVAFGGTNASTAEQARTNLSVPSSDDFDVVKATADAAKESTILLAKDNLLVEFIDKVGSGSSDKQLSIPLKTSEVLVVGDKYSIKGKLSFEHTGTLTPLQGLRIYIGEHSFFPHIIHQGSNIYFESVLTVSLEGTGDNLNIYFTPDGTASSTTKTTLHWAELTKGSSVVDVSTRTINGTLFNGLDSITTDLWGTARTLAYTGDATGSSSVNGSEDVTTTLTLADSGVVAGTYRSLEVDTKGRITSGKDVVTGLVTSTSASGVTNVATTNTNTFLNVVDKVGTVNTTTGTSTQITGAGTISVTSDTAGKLIITGASTDVSGLMVKSKNLSDVTDVLTSRTNLGVYSKLEVDTAISNIPSTTPYTLPTASNTVLGGIKVGTGLAITNGILSANDQTVDVSGLMVKSQNLSDVANKQTARTNLDVYSKAEVDAKAPVIPDASTTVKGVTALATQAEANKGTDANKALTPSVLPGAVKEQFKASGTAPMFACRAWVGFEGKGANIFGSGNILSVTKNSTGDYTVKFKEAMPNPSYNVTLGISSGSEQRIYSAEFSKYVEHLNISTFAYINGSIQASDLTINIQVVC